MRKKQKSSPTDQTAEARKKTPTFLLELPLRVTAGQAKRLRAHLEAARQFYNAVLSEGQRRLVRMRADPAWQAARAIPRIQKLERQRAFAALRAQYRFSEYALHEDAKGLNCAWIADHVDAALAQTLATRAYRALNRVCLGQARRVRFRSRGRGLGSVENKRNDTGLRFVLQPPEEGNVGYLLWQDDRLLTLIDWEDPVVTYGLAHRIKYARLIARQASGPRAQGADRAGQRYFVQLALDGVPYQKPRHVVGHDTVGLDLGPSTIAIVPREGIPRLDVLCAELAPDAQAIRRLQRQMDRQRRANNPDNYDEKGRIKNRVKHRLHWKHSKRYQATRRRKATCERSLAAHRKSLHGRLVHEIVAQGNIVITEQIAYRAWQKQFGKGVSLRAPGMLIAWLKRTGASHGRHPGRSSHPQYQIVSILSWLPSVCAEAALATLARVPLWDWAYPARPVLGISGCLSRSTRSPSLVCPIAVRRWLGRSGARPAGSIRVSSPTRKCETASASLLWYPQSRSASAQQSKLSHTRARLPSQAVGNVEAKQGTSAALARRGLRSLL